MREISEVAVEGFDLIEREAESDGDIGSKVFLKKKGFVIEESLFDAGVAGIVGGEEAELARDVKGRREGVEEGLDRGGVGPDESSGSEFDPAEVAGDDDGDIADIAILKDGKHGASGSSRGFAIVAGPLGDRGSVADPPRRTVVRRVWEVASDGGEKGVCFVEGRCVGGRGEKARTLDLDLDPRGFGRDRVAKEGGHR